MIAAVPLTHCRRISLLTASGTGAGAKGNFQHYRFLFAPGIRFGHRFDFANGIFSYLASPLLLLLIGLGFAPAWLLRNKRRRPGFSGR